MTARNIYFELTDAFNAEGRIAVLGSGQAVVHYRLAIMSKDGDWILREDERACQKVRSLLAERGAWETWERNGRQSMAERAQAEAERLLAEHQVPPLAEDQERELDEIMTEAGRELAG